MADMISAKPLDIVAFIEKYWCEKIGLLTVLIVLTVIEITFLANSKTNGWLILATLFLSDLLVVIVWFMSRRPPRTAKEKVGFLVSIYCADNRENEKLSEDFIIPLRRLVKTGKAGKVFHFMELPQRLAKNVIEPDDALLIRLRCRAHFMLYGRVRLRKIGDKEFHIIDLEGIVAHTPIPQQISVAITEEFTELLPRKVQIETENDLLSFQFTSEWADIVAKYIIGIAAAHSGDLDYAETLYGDALDRVSQQDPIFPVYSKLKERIPIRISELYEARAHAALKDWVESHDLRYIDRMGSYLQRICEARKGMPSIVDLRAICLFLKERNVDEAISLLKKTADNDNNGVCHYNLGFLHSYKGDLKTAVRHYRKAVSFEVEPEVLAMIEDFITWVIQCEPGQYQLHYSLGFFNWKAKGDEIQAQKDFQEFLRTADPSLYSKETELATKWLEEIGSNDESPTTPQR